MKELKRSANQTSGGKPFGNKTLGNKTLGNKTRPLAGNQTAQVSMSRTGKLPPNYGKKIKKRDAAAKAMIVVVSSLLISLIGLGAIFGFQIEMSGSGAYLYLLVSLSAIVYIASTIVYVVLSVRRKPQRP